METVCSSCLRQARPVSNLLHCLICRANTGGRASSQIIEIFNENDRNLFIQILNELLSSGSRTRPQSNDDITCELLHEAIELNCHQLVKAIVQYFPHTLFLSYQGNFPLHKACGCNECHGIGAVIQLIIQEYRHRGILDQYLFQKNNIGQTSLHLICKNKSMSVIDLRYFLQATHSYQPLPRPLAVIIYDLNLLHSAIQINDLEKARLMIELCPRAIFSRDENCNLPLHIICESEYVNNRDMLSLLLQEVTSDHLFDESWCSKNCLVQDNAQGLSPLDLVCKNRFMTDEVIDFLLDAISISNTTACSLLLHAIHCNNTTAVRGIINRYPITVLMRHARDVNSLGYVANEHCPLEAAIEELNLTDEEPISREDAWECFILCVQAANATRFCLSSSVLMPPVFAAMGIVPPKVLEKVIDRFDPELKGTGHNGETALVFAIQIATSTEDECCEIPFIEEEAVLGRRFVKNICQIVPGSDDTHGLFELLLSERYGLYSMTTIRDTMGRLPIHFAAQRGLDWSAGLEIMYIRSILSVGDEDKCSQLFPFMLAAADPPSDLTSIMALLHHDPSIIKQLVIKRTRENQFS